MRLPSLLKSRPATVLSCGPNSFTSPPLTTKALLPADAAIAPVARWAATCSNHLPFWLAISLAVPSAAMRSSLPSSPPLTKPSPAGSPTSASTAPPCNGSAAGVSAALTSAGNRRTRRQARRLQRHGPAAGSAARPDLKDRASRLLQAVVEAALEILAVEVAADEDELARALLAFFPGRAPVGIHHHVHALVDVASRRAVDGQNALAAEDVGTTQLQQCAHPLLELVRIDRPVGAERQAFDLFLMIVIVAMVQEVGLELENALQIEGTLVEDVGKLDLALLRR